MINKMTKQEFKSTVRIYKSHPLAKGLISITYASVLGKNTVSTERTVVVEKIGGALTSLYNDICC
jgi:hypothetical protein